MDLFSLPSTCILITAALYFLPKENWIGGSDSWMPCWVNTYWFRTHQVTFRHLLSSGLTFSEGLTGSQHVWVSSSWMSATYWSYGSHANRWGLPHSSSLCRETWRCGSELDDSNSPKRRRLANFPRFWHHTNGFQIWKLSVSFIFIPCLITTPNILFCS